MFKAVPWLLAAALLSACPALAEGRRDNGGDRGWAGDHGGGWRGRGEGGWRGGEGSRGEPQGGAWRARGEDGAQNGQWRGRNGGEPQGQRYRSEGPREGGPVYAEPRNGQHRQQQDEARDRVRRGELRSLPNVIDGIRRRQPGRQLDAGIEAWGDGRPTYRVRWAAPNGRLMDYIVDARTGAILSVEGR